MVVSNRKLFPSLLWRCVTCDSLNPGPDYTVMEKCFLSNQSGTLAYGLHKSKIFSPPARDYVHYVRNNTLERIYFLSKIMEVRCSLLPGEPFRNRRDKFHPGMNKTTPTTFLLFKPSASHHGVSNRKLFLLRCGGVLRATH
ncbi:hypothetical protein CDAR_291881 [Caerostris darwini]|uniref:Uncharacterized protein n=1 Tax=Caerostris darwini TaxID=1538125 RepID=A0AAV4NVN5_9ARAC|nr:hypothetical protein CDAR_291881 [Caerostris darwini]